MDRLWKHTASLEDLQVILDYERENPLELDHRTNCIVRRMSSCSESSCRCG